MTAGYVRHYSYAGLCTMLSQMNKIASEELTTRLRAENRTGHGLDVRRKSAHVDRECQGGAGRVDVGVDDSVVETDAGTRYGNRERRSWRTDEPLIPPSNQSRPVESPGPSASTTNGAVRARSARRHRSRSRPPWSTACERQSVL